ncbi:MAG: DNA repair protein RecN [Sideroxydans sp.]|nr:DNA repair protein RecN [Sideroxydans sp.]
MLKFLSIRDFVIVATLELDFTAGFTALTGETGAGKSILIDALSLALGERGDASMVRAGCERAEICAEFDASVAVQSWLAAQDLAGDDGVCLLRRVLEAGGRSRGFINGRPATLQQMRELGEMLLAIHGQHAHQALLRADAQRELLDSYAGILAQASELAAHYQGWQALRSKRLLLTENAAAVAAERELLQFQCEELAGLNFNLADWQSEQADYARLSHSASLLETAEFGIDMLSEADNACLTQLSSLTTRMRDALQHDANLSDTLKMLESAQAELQESVYALRHYQQHLDSDPQALQALETRIQNVMDAARKYRATPENLVEVLQRNRQRLDELGGDADVAELEKQEHAAQKIYQQAAQKLSLARQKSATKLSAEITAAMQTLAMQGGAFSVALQPLKEGSAHGLESIDLQVAANPGVPARSLAKVASGGELSRISLAIQVATSKLASVPTLIFDEVDSGIGGRVAEIVGQLLRQLGTHYQVLCVTHLPQVAACANQQWQVSKAVEQGVTLSHIAVLDESLRVEEIARMLGGTTLTDTTRKHASEMLAQSAKSAHRV